MVSVLTPGCRYDTAKSQDGIGGDEGKNCMSNVDKSLLVNLL